MHCFVHCVVRIRVCVCVCLCVCHCWLRVSDAKGAQVSSSAHFCNSLDELQAVPHDREGRVCVCVFVLLMCSRGKVGKADRCCSCASLMGSSVLCLLLVVGGGHVRSIVGT
jgi:hypothetical protein